jgi:hypothetical protein
MQIIAAVAALFFLSTTALADSEHVENELTTRNMSRPHFVRGTIVIQDRVYHFGSGGGVWPSIPYGSYLITPSEVGSWGASHGALGMAHNSIWDPQLRMDREGIEFHSDYGDLRSNGCIAIREYEEFKRHVLQLLVSHEQLYFQISAEGARITYDPIDQVGRWWESLTNPLIAVIEDRPAHIEGGGMARRFVVRRNRSDSPARRASMTHVRMAQRHHYYRRIHRG